LAETLALTPANPDVVSMVTILALEVAPLDFPIIESPLAEEKS
jgi:hypothetical protein